MKHVNINFVYYQEKENIFDRLKLMVKVKCLKYGFLEIEFAKCCKIFFDLQILFRVLKGNIRI